MWSTACYLHVARNNVTRQHVRHAWPQTRAMTASSSTKALRFTDEEEGVPPTLPPLLAPDRKQQRCESSVGVGVSLVLLSIGFNAITGLMSWWPPGAHAVGTCILYVETGIILGALLGMFFGDPGEVRRTPETLTPMPQEVEEKLRAGEALSGLQNIKGEGEESYCVRCLVWRRPKPVEEACVPCASFVMCAKMCAEMLGGGVDVAQPAHHCSTCERCVLNFDHHCGFFGRCIAEGNMLYFRTMLTMGIVGPSSVLLFVPFTIGFAFGWVALVALAVLLGIGAVLFVKYDGSEKCNTCCMMFICQVVMPATSCWNRICGLDGDDLAEPEGPRRPQDMSQGTWYATEEIPAAPRDANGATQTGMNGLSSSAYLGCEASSASDLAPVAAGSSYADMSADDLVVFAESALAESALAEAALVVVGGEANEHSPEPGQQTVQLGSEGAQLEQGRQEP